MIKLGTTFWGSSPGDLNGKHLWFVVSDPTFNHGVVLIANMTTRRSGSEDCCVLQPGDHPSIKRESVINYLRARCVPAKNIEEAYKMRPDCIMFAEPADEILVIRILRGALKSNRVSPEWQELARKELTRIAGSNIASKVNPPY